MPPEYMAWKADVAQRLIAVGAKPLDGKITMQITVLFSGAKVADTDNLGGAIMDACNGVLYHDDRQVYPLTVIPWAYCDNDVITIDVTQQHDYEIVAQRIIKLDAQSLSKKAIADQLNGAGVLTRTGNVWTAALVGAVIKSGEVR